MSTTETNETTTATTEKATKAKKEKAVKLPEVRGFVRVNPADLVIADDEGHPLYDERKDYPLDKQKLAYNKEHGLPPGNVLTAIKDGGKLFVVDGRQRTGHLRHVNKERVKEGLEPHLAEVKVLHGISLSEAADLMELLNNLRVDDPIMVQARKVTRRVNRLIGEAVSALPKDADEKAVEETKKTAEKEAIESSASIFNVDKQTVRNRFLAITRAIQPAQDACEAGKIGFGDLVEIAKSVDAETQLARLKEFIAKREGGEPDDESDDEDEEKESEPKERKRAPKGIGKAKLLKIADEAQIPEALQFFCRLIAGDNGRGVKSGVLAEWPGLKPFLEKKAKKAKATADAE